ncbi:hypothetical protein [Treponema phagedenis]|uniref:Uncharacterized protein n=3 Tax=Treponema phagedenis TaxID=162 RepID=A0AAE6IVK4_TREPH|nr:hypothetical protein [Treponema phagedenis]NVP23608.1 hypothetical protein [Treponema phagedenis]QEJ98741.1 hypothetical protein FUT82_12540 [Treponema phagedenis]QEK04246.1 hypothetical protein FUT83_10825 [Treponema phagedenis]QEK09861.1 hypothetical protein FUT81_10740 [Treponema phagedenis]QLC58439.1 hypothetical protein HW453_06155 [Treponema phagedenis]
MKMKNIKIKSYEQVSALIETIITGESDLKNASIAIDETLGGILIHIEGDKFHSTITTGIMRGVISLQKALYDGYSLVQYGKIQKLTTAEKEMLELQVKVDDGSSIIEILIDALAKAIGEKMEKLTAKEIKNIVMTVVLAGGVFFLGGKYIDAKKEIARIESQGKVITEVQKNTIYAIEAMQTGGKAFSREMAKQEFDNLEINGEQVTQDELREWSKTTRVVKPIETKIYRGRFIITDIHFENDTIYLDVVNIQDQIVIKYVNILRELVDKDDYQWFKDSTNRQPIDMTIVSTEKQGKIIAAYLQNFKK